QYLDNWINKLRKDGLQKEYDVGPNAISATGYGLLLMTSTTGNNTGEVFYAMDNIVDEDQ
ncbi:hypothetical protein GGF37_002011, partial [Kickxella alabastrina]